MHAMVDTDLVTEPVRVDLGVLRQRRRDDFEQNVVDGDLELVSQLEHCRSHLDHAGQIELRGEVESRDRPERFGKPARDGLPNLRERDILEIACSGRCALYSWLRTRAGAGRSACSRRGFDIALDDPAAGTGALHPGDIEPAFTGNPP